MNKQLLMAINQICAERNLKPQVVIEAVEQALVSAYRRNFGSSGNVEAKLDPETGDMLIFAKYEVVAPEEIVDPKIQVSPIEAASLDPDKTEIGDEIYVERTPDDFGRIAAQTAKQVILQRIREAERDSIYDDYSEREGELVQGVLRSIDYNSGNLIISMDGGRVEAVMHRSDQIPGERHRPNSSILAYVSEVSRGTRGPVIYLSRSHRNMLRRLLEKEVPEIKQGAVEIKAIAREAGSRSKIAVVATQSGVDPVGSCVGMRGVRIQNIVNELSGEKIDVIEWDPDGEHFVANALSPARVTDVLLFAEHDKTAMVVVPDNQLSLAIGKEGQNARLVAKLTGWRIDIKSETEATAEGLDELERQRLRTERKERTETDDLLEAAKRILADEQADPTAELMPDLIDTDALIDELEEDPAALQLEDVELSPVAETPVLEDVLDDESDEAEAIDLAARLSEAMTTVDNDEFGFDDDAFSRVFGEDKKDEEEEDDDQPKSKKKRRKDRRLVFDEQQGRVVAVKKRKRDRGGAGQLEFDDIDTFDD
ncbi:MAG: transcription termination/antitermination protein NusA [Chloroflexi bacterium]|nr:transcription termination/antitermination protein NusA [Chloroflexota bacterium]